MTAGASIQERLETGRAGRLLISAFLLATLAAIVVTNLPESSLRGEALRVAEPYLNATGLDQDWRVFAPDPRQASIEVQARVTYRDGSTEIWRPPSGDDLSGAYWDYRWRKWMENAMQDGRRHQLWRPAALYVAREMSRGGARPAAVTLVRRWRDLARPGAAAGERPWQSQDFFRIAVGGGAG
jgi:Family of unknown function (DUF5819)